MSARPPVPDAVMTATLTGQVNLLHPDPATITIEAIAHGLANIKRWTGALETPFSVAQHSVLVADIFCRHRPDFRRWRLYALKHDAHEYLLGDITRPVEKLICLYDADFSRRLSGIKMRIDRAIADRFELPPAPPDVLAAIDEADVMAAGAEWRAMMPGANGPSPYPTAPWRLRPQSASWPDAADQFRLAFTEALAERAWAA